MSLCKNLGYDEVAEAIANHESCMGIEWRELVSFASTDEEFKAFIMDKWQIDVTVLLSQS